jgi:hypothetical protein
MVHHPLHLPPLLLCQRAPHPAPFHGLPWTAAVRWREQGEMRHCLRALLQRV